MSAAQREWRRLEHGYLAPRLSQAEAIQEAALMADQFERAFLRLVRECRNYRRVVGNLVVAGGQVNVTDGPHQINNLPAIPPNTNTTDGPCELDLLGMLSREEAAQLVSLLILYGVPYPD